MMKFILITCTLVLLSLTAICQQRTIKGTILDQETGQSLAGVSVRMTGSNAGTISNANGDFSLKVPLNESLLFSHTGYIIQSIKITAETEEKLIVRLTPAIMQMTELMVIAYGTANKKTYTGSVATITSEDLQRTRSNSVLNSLQGTIPGLQLQNKASGGGKSSQSILIRGASTINASTTPLYIIDGVPGDAIDQLNPDDVSSVSVLKDASAISLYGARATNGVILITTKQGARGVGGKAKVSYSGQVGISERTGKDYKMVSPKDYYELTWEAMRNGAIDDPGVLTAGGKKYTTPAEYATTELLNVFGYNAYNMANPVGLDGKLNPAAQLLWWENYEAELLKKGLRHEHSFNISGATDRLKYYVSTGYLDQKGLEPGNSGFSRFTTRVNMSYDISKIISAGVNIGLTNSNSKNNYINNGYADFADYARLTPGLYPLYKRDETGKQVYDVDGNPILDFGDGPANILNSRRPDVTSTGVNPLGTLDLDKASGKGRYLLTNFFINFKLYKGLDFKATYASNTYENESRNYRNRTIGAAVSTKGALSVNTSEAKNWTANGILSYRKSWQQAHSIQVLLGTELNKRTVSSLNAAVTGFSFEGMDELANGATIVKPAIGLGTSSTDRLIGFFSRAEYDYRSRYFLSASLRRDGSSHFHPDTRWGNFWSLGASWILSEENFLKNAKWITNLKIRSSYGTSGNIGTNDYRSYYQLGYTFLGAPGAYIASLANKNLKWETNKQLNVGTDMGIFNNRVRITADWYNRITDDLFYNVPLSPSIGFSNVLRNIGKLKNTGFEFSLATDNIRFQDFTWTTIANISSNKNKILALNQDEFVSGNRIYKVGQSTTEFYIREYAGVNPNNGNPQWYIDEVDTKSGEKTGKRIPTENWGETTTKTIKLDDGTNKTFKNLGRYSVGNFTPTISGGFQNLLRYKNFDFSFLFNFSLGSEILMLDYVPISSSGYTTVKLFHEDMLNRWQNQGDITNIPRLTTKRTGNYTGSSSYISTFYMRSGDYLKLKNVNFGYTLPPRVTNFLKITSARLYMLADNVFYFSAEQGFDPEQVTVGIVSGNYPAISTYSFGVKIDF